MINIGMTIGRSAIRIGTGHALVGFGYDLNYMAINVALSAFLEVFI